MLIKLVMVGVVLLTKLYAISTSGLTLIGVSFVLYIAGIKRPTPALASMVAMVEPVTATLFGVAILKASLSIIQKISMELILVTVTALSVVSS